MNAMTRTISILGLLGCVQLHLHAASGSGYVLEWGWNTATGTAMPVKLVASNVVAISAGSFHNLALSADSSVVGWGDNFFGQALGYKTSEDGITNGVVRINSQILSNVVSIVASRASSLALKRDGAVLAWGENYIPKELTNIVAIAADEAHSWVLKRDGTVVGWWRENSGSYGLLTAENVSNAVAIAVGSAPQGRTRGIALRSDSTVMNWGAETTYQDASPPRGLSNVIAVAAGYNHTLALKHDGTVVGWGFNKLGQATGVPTTNSPYVSAGGVTLDGQTLSNVVAISAGQEYSMALKKDGTVVTWGRMVNGLYPATVPRGLSNVVAIAAGDSFCLAITTNSAVADKFRH